jgi:TRAP-type C4-dicarboxylate transport system permease small subunit
MDPESVVFLGIPQRYLAMIVPTGFGLIMVQFLIRLIESVVAALRGVPEEDFL